MSDRPSGMAVGFTVFAGVMLVTIGILHALWGLVALFNDEFFVVGADYTFKFDATAWGWIHLLAGIVAIIAGFSLFTGRVWARVVGVGLAVVSIIANFASIPYYPVWSIVIIALDVAVIWALTLHGRDIVADNQ